MYICKANTDLSPRHLPCSPLTSTQSVSSDRCSVYPGLSLLSWPHSRLIIVSVVHHTSAYECKYTFKISSASELSLRSIVFLWLKWTALPFDASLPVLALFRCGSKILTKTTPEALIAYFKVYFKDNLVPTVFFYTLTHWSL